MPRSPSRSSLNVLNDLALRSQSRPPVLGPQTGRPLSPAIVQRGPVPFLSPSIAVSPGLGAQAGVVRPGAFNAHGRQYTSGLANTDPPQPEEPKLFTFDPRRLAFPEEPYLFTPAEGPYGYYPMRLGQKLRNGQYEIVRKLGWGANASVWLAKENLRNGHRYVAIKILTVNATHGEARGIMHDVATAQAMCALKKSGTRHPGYQHCASIKDIFNERSPHGTHACIACVPYGTSLDFLLEPPGSSTPNRFPLSVVKKITRQVLQSLSFLHDKFHVVHLDVRTPNIVVHLRASTADIDRFLAGNPAQVYPDPPPVDTRISQDAIYPVRSQPLPNFGLDPSYDNIKVSLLDYGGVTRVSDIRTDTRICTPEELRAPEQVLGHGWSQPVDVWAVGCLVFYLLTTLEAFPMGWFPYTQDSHLAQIYDRLGQFPMDFVRRCPLGLQFIGPDGVPLRGDPGARDSLESKIANAFTGMSPQDTSAACRFLRRCFAIDPSTRATVAELLADAWLAS